MRKVKVLAIILVLSMMLTGAAYALWSETIAVTTTATMGEMKLTLTCDNDVYPLSEMPGIGWSWQIWDTYPNGEDYMNPVNGTVSSDHQSFNVTVGDLYPGAMYGLDFQIRNTGDVPFELGSCAVNYTGGNWDLFAQMSGSFQFTYQRANGDNRLITVPVAALTSAGLGDAITAACADIILYPGDELYGGHQDEATTFMQVAVSDTITGDQFENDTTSFRVDFNWQQCAPTYDN